MLAPASKYHEHLSKFKQKSRVHLRIYISRGDFKQIFPSFQASLPAASLTRRFQVNFSPSFNASYFEVITLQTSFYSNFNELISSITIITLFTSLFRIFKRYSSAGDNPYHLLRAFVARSIISILPPTRFLNTFEFSHTRAIIHRNKLRNKL